MSRLAFKENGTYKGIVTYSEKVYTEEELKKMHDEFIAIENALKQKCKNEYDSEYSYELGLILASKLKEYEIVESTRFYFWAILREGVNTKDKRKVFQAKQRDPYEYDYLLSKLPKELALKYSRSKWDHLFDVTTARKDDRIYKWLIDVQILDIDDEIYTIYNDCMYKSIFLVNYMKKNNIKVDSKKRSEFFISAKKVDGKDTSKLEEIIIKII